MTDKKTATSDWKEVPPTPIDPILGLKPFYLADKRANKVDLTIGVYKDDNGKSWVLPSVLMANGLIQKD